METQITATRQQAHVALRNLTGFLGIAQSACLCQAMRGEERQFFYELVVSLAERVRTMPKTYEQDGKGMQAVAYLHYFIGGCDWYITEKDTDPDGTGQVQAFGQADLGYGPELGYISIPELLDNGVELDLYFQPTALEAINTK